MLELLGEALEGAPRTGEGAVELGVERVAGEQPRQRRAQLLEAPGDARQLAGPLALGPLAQALGVAPGAFVVERVHEQLRMRDEAFAGGAVGAGVVLIPAPEFAGRQRLLGQRGQQRVRMLGVGARQRGEDAHRRPARQLALAERFE